MSTQQASYACPALVIDGSSACFFAGILSGDGSWLALERADAPALESLFLTVERVLKGAGLELEAIRSFIYCEGPGSVLGLRLCAMAIETWSRLIPDEVSLYSFNAMHLVAAHLLDENRITEKSLLISDWKKDAWNSLKLSPEGVDSVAPISTDKLNTWQGPLFHLPARKGWQQAPALATELDYSPECLPAVLQAPGLIKQTASVELYQSGLNTFQKWTPQRHRAISS